MRLSDQLREAVEQERSFRLEGIRDMREIDLDTGKRLPLEAGAGSRCDRCGREHAVVWSVQELTPGRRRMWSVGSTCGPKILAGWSPEKSELTKAKRVDTLKAKWRAWKKAINRALGFGARFKGRPLPPLERVPNKWREGWDRISIKGVDKSPGYIQVKAGEPITKDVEDKLFYYWLDKEAERAGFKRPGLRYVVVKGARGATLKDVLVAKRLDLPWEDVIKQLKRAGEWEG